MDPVDPDPVDPDPDLDPQHCFAESESVSISTKCKTELYFFTEHFNILTKN